MRDAEDVAADIDRALTSELDPDWPTAIALIEADRREAKLEALGKAYQRIEAGARWDLVLDQMMIELTAIRSGADSDDE